MKKVVLLSCFNLVLVSLQAQDETKSVQLGVRVGVGFASLEEKRFSSQVQQGILPTYSMDIETYKNKVRQNLSINFSLTQDYTNQPSLSYVLVFPEVRYTYMKSLSDNWYIGGMFHSFTLLNFPESELTKFVNNSISYTLAQSIGPSLFYQKTALNQKISFESECQLGLLSYVVRPAFAHPYPENYLQPDVFSPDRSGMMRSLFKGGKLWTLNKIQNIHLNTSTSYNLPNWKFSANLAFSTLRLADVKPFSLSQLYFGVGIKYKYKKT